MKFVKIQNKKPPEWILKEVKERFNVEWESGVIFTYGKLITNYYGKMTEDLMAHEPHHIKQQEKYGGADKWWRRYLDDAEFRYNQELECYRKQYKWIKNNIKDRNEANKYLMHYTRSLSGKMYGNIKDFNEVMKDIIK